MADSLLSFPPEVAPEDWDTILRAAGNPEQHDVLRGSPLTRIYSPLINVSDLGRPLVFAQLGQSLDGRIATATGKSHFINGLEAIRHLHRLRALADAVVVGVGTVIADDPQLTVRQVPGPNPARVIIDPAGRLPATARCLGDDGVRRIVLQTVDVPRPHGVEALTLPSDGGRIAPAAIIDAVGGLGFRRILVEGGADTVSRFLDACLLDRLHLLIAPMIIGSGPTGISLGAIDGLADALRPRHTIYRFDDGDLLVDCAFGRVEGTP
jgi:riboflavin-specific deaminase-like protein